MDKFEKYSNYDPRSSFTQIQFGHDTGILETELNELQQIQERSLVNLAKHVTSSGFTEPVRVDFTGEPVVYNPTENGLTLVNRLAIAPFKAIVNGRELDARGSFTYNKLDDYILIDLGKTSATSTKDSLVYLEIWYELVRGDAVVNAYGYVDGESIGSPAVDQRVGAETSRRIVTRWAVRVKNEVDFDKYADGFGYSDVLHYSPVFAKADGEFGSVTNVNTVFAPATSSLFVGEDFHGDRNLFVAGRPDYSPSSSTLFGDYVFALPMLRVRRRNSTAFSIANYNGAPSNNRMRVVNDSSVAGDLLGGMRPDHLAYDVVAVNDVLDLRRTVGFSAVDANHVGEDVVRELFNGTLSTLGHERTRRVQFGNTGLDFDKIPGATLVVPFDGSTLPVVPAFDPLRPITVEAPVVYEDSVRERGVVVDGNTEFSYTVHDATTTLLTADRGTLDFYLKPFWNGCDDTSQVIISLVNESGSPIIRLAKDKQKLILSQFNYEEANANYEESRAIVDLTSTQIIANRYYHVRLAWTVDPMPLNGQTFIYLNGKLSAQADCNQCHLVATKLVVGSSTNTSELGVLLDTLIGYSRSFEVLSSSNALYGYAKNSFWPMLPKDFVNGDSLLMPSFNKILNNFGDNAHDQADTIIHLHNDPSATLNTFHLVLNSDKLVRSVQSVYDLQGSTVTGVWTNLGTSSATFMPYDQTVDQVVVQATVSLSPGCGGQDMPTEILAAAVVNYDDVATNYDYNLNLTGEVSFAAASAQAPRSVNLLRPRKVAGNEDAAYDFPNSKRTKSQCYARLLYYNVSGDGTNQYKIPMHLYGYKVCGVVGCNNQKITKVTKTPNPIFGEEDLYFTVFTANAVLVGVTVTFELATEGLSFDHDLSSKTIVSDVTRCSLLEFAADGVNSTFTLPCCSVVNEGSIHGGVLRSVFTFIDNQFDANGDLTDVHDQTVQCYHDGEIFYDEHGNPTTERVFNTINVKVTDASFGTPFVTIIFDPNDKPRKGTVIQLPILTTYQLTSSTLLSVWYKYTPYQGALDTALHELTRVSPWSFFVTTLSTGKPAGALITKNVVNHLPGGGTYGYTVDNADVELTSTLSDMALTAKTADLNRKLVFTNDVMLRNNNDLCNLTTSLKVTKNCALSQDGLLTFTNVDFDLFLSDCSQPVSKYVGAFCTVKLDDGEVGVLVVGNLDVKATVVNHLDPVYGDVFLAPGRPVLQV